MSATTARTNGRARVPAVAAAPAPIAPAHPPGSQLMAAILKVQAQAPKLAPNADGQIQSRSYRYVTLDAVVDAVLELLVSHELVWTAFPTSDEQGQPALRYRITHLPSGEYQEDVMNLMLAHADPQGQGSGLTYARRYALVAVLNLTTGDDDDGAAASQTSAVITADVHGAREFGSESGGNPQPAARAAQPSERPLTANQRTKLLIPRAQKAKLADGEFANVLLTVGGEPPREWRNEEHAAATLKRLLERCPARLKDQVLAGIDQAGAAKGQA